MRAVFALIPLCLALGACAPVLQQGPDGDFVDANTAAMLFNRVCGETAPTFSGYFDKVTNGQYQREGQTNIFNHKRFDLSFQLSEGASSVFCDMTFRSSEDPVSIALFLSGTLPATGPMDLDQDTGAASRTLAPGLTFSFQPALTEDFQHVARIEAGVR